MAFPPPTPPLNKEETEEFLERLENFKLSQKQKDLYKDAEEMYRQVSKQ